MNTTGRGVADRAGPPPDRTGAVPALVERLPKAIGWAVTDLAAVGPVR